MLKHGLPGERMTDKRSGYTHTVQRKRKKADHRAVSLHSTSIRHPLNVKPSGNSVLVSQGFIKDIRSKSMGDFGRFSDDLFMEILSYINDVESMKNLSHTSRFMYAYLYDEELWKLTFVRLSGRPSYSNELEWLGSWRSSLTRIPINEVANIELPANALCSDVLYRPFQCALIDYSTIFARIINDEKDAKPLSSESFDMNCVTGQQIPRLEEQNLSLDTFIKKLSHDPFILTNQDENRWPKWDIDSLLQKFADVKFRQEAVHWKLSSYVKYLQKNSDESPLYLFDCKSTAMQSLVKEYEAPEIFQEDLFKVFEDKSIDCRPDYAWLIVGPARSGSTFHKDPNFTSAWNTAISGRKLWIMFPSHVTPPGVSTSENEEEVTAPVGLAEWVYAGFFNDCLNIPECKIAVTFPGECMHVPSGWWHMVINIDDSVALTQNFVPVPKLPKVLQFLREKKNQISGFTPDRVINAVENFIRDHDDDGDDEAMEELKQYRDAAKVKDKDVHEDCGELSSLTLMPIYQLFKKLLHDKGLLLNDEKASTENGVQLKSVTISVPWKSLSNPANKESTFSFGFGSDEDD